MSDSLLSTIPRPSEPPDAGEPLDVVALSDRLVVFRSPWLLPTHREIHRNNLDELALFMRRFCGHEEDGMGKNGEDNLHATSCSNANKVAATVVSSTPIGAKSTSTTLKRRDFQIFDLTSNSILKEYAAQKFGSKLISFDYDSGADHGPPALELVLEFSSVLAWWLHLDPSNVAFLHFKENSYFNLLFLLASVMATSAAVEATSGGGGRAGTRTDGTVEIYDPVRGPGSPDWGATSDGKSSSTGDARSVTSSLNEMANKQGEGVLWQPSARGQLSLDLATGKAQRPGAPARLPGLGTPTLTSAREPEDGLSASELRSMRTPKLTKTFSTRSAGGGGSRGPPSGGSGTVSTLSFLKSAVSSAVQKTPVGVLSCVASHHQSQSGKKNFRDLELDYQYQQQFLDKKAIPFAAARERFERHNGSPPLTNGANVAGFSSVTQDPLKNQGGKFREVYELFQNNSRYYRVTHYDSEGLTEFHFADEVVLRGNICITCYVESAPIWHYYLHTNFIATGRVDSSESPDTAAQPPQQHALEFKRIDLDAERGGGALPENFRAVCVFEATTTASSQRVSSGGRTKGSASVENLRQLALSQRSGNLSKSSPVACASPGGGTTFASVANGVLEMKATVGVIQNGVAQIGVVPVVSNRSSASSSGVPSNTMMSRSSSSSSCDHSGESVALPYIPNSLRPHLLFSARHQCRPSRQEFDFLKKNSDCAGPVLKLSLQLAANKLEAALELLGRHFGVSSIEMRKKLREREKKAADRAAAKKLLLDRIAAEAKGAAADGGGVAGTKLSSPAVGPEEVLGPQKLATERLQVQNYAVSERGVAAFSSSQGSTSRLDDVDVEAMRFTPSSSSTLSEQLALNQLRQKSKSAMDMIICRVRRQT
eukprot:g5173.t1